MRLARLPGRLCRRGCAGHHGRGAPLAKATKLKTLREERDKTEARCRKERQLTRKNELFRQMRALEKQIEELEKGGIDK